MLIQRQTKLHWVPLYWGDIRWSQSNHSNDIWMDRWQSRKKKKGLTVFWMNWTLLKESSSRRTKGSRFVRLAVLISCRCKAILMSVASVAISRWAGNLSPLPLPRWPGWRFNFVEVLADYSYLSAAVMENAAQAGGERGAGTLIRTAALGRFPWREQWDRAGKDTLDVRWKHQDHPHCSTLAGIQVPLIIW